jgi:hypothetical protein
MDAETTITAAEGYRAMFAFLEAYWERGLKSSDDIAVMLGSMNYADENGTPRPLDIAQWHDWLDTVKAIRQ